MTLDTIMTKHVISVSMDDTLRTIRDTFDRYKFHHVVVLEKCRLVGVITDRDLLMNLSPFVGKPSERTMDAASLNRHAHQIMERRVITARAETPVGDAALMMLNNHVSCLPVVDEAGAVVGIVTWRDLLRWTLEHLTDNACPTALRAQQPTGEPGRRAA
jgi:acetoin utilization protein AcuB